MTTGGLRADHFELPPNVFENTATFIETVRQRIPGKIVRHAVELLGDRDLLARVLGTTARNLGRFYRKESLSRKHSEAVLETLRLYLETLRVWDSAEAARGWLNSRVPALNGEEPTNLFDTSEGRRWVRQVLQAIESGEFS